MERVDTGSHDGLTEFLDAAFDAEVALSPQTAALLGLDHDPGRLDDRSDAGRLRHLELLRSQRAELLRRFPTETLGPEGRLNAAMFTDRVARAEAAFTWRHHIAPGSAIEGPEESAAFLIGKHRIASVENAENYISRVRDIARVLTERAERLDVQRGLGITPTALQITQLRRTLLPYDDGDGSPLLADFTTKLAALGLPAARHAGLVADATDAVHSEVRAGRERYQAAIDEIAAHPRADDGVWSLPDGDAYYAAALRRWNTTDLTADRIHEIGLAQVEQIHAEMREVMRVLGATGTVADFAEKVRADPQFRYADDAAGHARYLADAERYLAESTAISSRLFRALPKAPIEVRAVESWREANAPIAFYELPSPDGERPGFFYLNLATIAEAQTIQLPGMVYHEGIPGHHFQIALAQERTDLPRFRRFDIGYGAYVEGWGLYAERLADELGLYGDPYARFGMLSLQLWRACRLVLDTGLHAKRWTRARAIAYFAANSSISHADIEKEVDRYIGLPGQATSYTIGQLRIQDLRTRAETALGPHFDLRDFHDAILADGALPLHLLDTRVDHWIGTTAR
ncbi:DUF885 domain-containing protein [Catenuloplanes sp. NPDC051500]|uniref:DUF885 domain-containing protein n=1 Tax=Catenuloplanes sp. NPDC051500 TaxID=3363959 RepID=UPI0037953D1D